MKSPPRKVRILGKKWQLLPGNPENMETGEMSGYCYKLQCRMVYMPGIPSDRER